jgi:hypothetical protein
MIHEEPSRSPAAALRPSIEDLPRGGKELSEEEAAGAMGGTWLADLSKALDEMEGQQPAKVSGAGASYGIDDFIRDVT